MNSVSGQPYIAIVGEAFLYHRPSVWRLFNLYIRVINLKKSQGKNKVEKIVSMNKNMGINNSKIFINTIIYNNIVKIIIIKVRNNTNDNHFRTVQYQTLIHSSSTFSCSLTETVRKAYYFACVLKSYESKANNWRGGEYKRRNVRNLHKPINDSNIILSCTIEPL